MKLVPVEKVPDLELDKYPRKKRGVKLMRPIHRLQEMFKDFVESNHDVCRLDFTDRDYKSPMGCYKAIYNTIKNSHYNIKVVKRGDEIYLVRVV